jgi:hypothetical protein
MDILRTIELALGPGVNWTGAPVVLLLLLGGLLLSTEVGRRLRVKHLRAAPGESIGLGAVTGAVFGLMGLMVAFTFSGAASRFDHRRDLIVEEANDIGTAYLRIDLLPEAARGPLKDEFRAYVDSRLQTYRVGTDWVRIDQLLKQTSQQQNQIWKMSLEGIDHASSPPVAAQIVAPLNAMFDIVTTRTAATQMHPPGVVWMMLGGLTLACSLLAGYEMGVGVGRKWLHALMFASIFSLTLYVIVDMEFPRLGFIRVTAVDSVLQDVRDSMR